MDLCFSSVTEALEGFATKAFTPVDLVESSLARIDALNVPLNAFSYVDAAGALAAAQASWRRWQDGAPLGTLDGIPVSVKDLWMVEGMPLQRGSALYDTTPSSEDAPAVARLREQGAIFLGKTTTSEFGWKGVTHSPKFGISRNPWNPAKTSGGSSGGAAIAAATGMGILHLGSDGGGSIRIPSAFCGVYGFKPSYGRVAASPLGVLPMLSHSGPIVRSVDDARRMLTVIAQPDPRDWLCLPKDDIVSNSRFEGSLAGLKIGYSRDLGYAVDIDPEIASAVDAMVSRLADLGAQVELVDPPFPCAADLYRIIYSSGFAAIISGFDERQLAMLDPGLFQWGKLGETFSGIDLMHAWGERAKLGGLMNRFHERHDVLITPQMSLTAFDAGLDRPSTTMTMGPDWNQFAYPFNLTGQPAASVPCGLHSNGLPMAMQIVGPRYGDELVLRVSDAAESLMAFPRLSLADSLTKISPD